MRIYERANAKINLYLDVTGIADNGFHALRSVMQTVGLYDGITVDAMPAAEPSVSVSVCGRYRVPVGEGNLAYRAAMLYMDAAAIPMRVHARLEKHIPVAAGLGGGSADAAAVLRALNRAAGRRLSISRLLELAAQLGSDVPFCLVGHTRLCEGRGERMQPLAACPPMPIVILPSPERVSTPAAYAALDTAFCGFKTPSEHADLSAMRAALTAGDVDGICASLYNIFEDVILPTVPIAAENRAKLLSLGARAAMMSGSGPTIFGFFTSEEGAKAAADAIGGGAVATVTV